ncbi:hypothetical protein UFOVP181_246 [uncultured Caudovirales phage]|uniref:Uncharacterized protein n=1 Tax=uncultured Caudovirales phage TaxID=2100421 RepID=A0A6J7WH20_9CAUD|nr:hypothetical protein UFOVP57_393 [uncultured Caudovirales phage]CAB5208919.1 hypothetical protein UFOVP181_246 [uncultured Caudovirales phage]
MTTLQSIIDSIDPLFPVAGVDNDSQGFRDNFNYIKDALTTENANVTALQSNVVLTANLINGDPVDNDLQGSTINNGFFNNFHSVAHVSSAIGSTNVDITAGNIQEFTLTTNSSFTFRNWPVSGKYATVRLHFVSNGTGDYTVDFANENGGTVVLESSFPSTLTVTTTGTHHVVEAWCYTGSTNKVVYARYLGEF